MTFPHFSAGLACNCPQNQRLERKQKVFDLLPCGTILALAFSAAGANVFRMNTLPSPGFPPGGFFYSRIPFSVTG